MTFTPAPRVRFDDRLRTACGAGGMTTATRQRFTRRPYLQKVDHDSASLLWAADMGSSFEVRTWLPGQEPGPPLVAKRDGTLEYFETPQFEVELTGLPAASIVCYQIEVDGVPWTQPLGFLTAPAPDDEAATVRFAAFGDVGKQTSDQYAVLNHLLAVEFDFAIVTGDLAYDDGKPHEYDENFFGVYRNVMDRVPFFVASGNHEYNTSDAGPFREAFALPENGGPGGIERWYSFDWGPVHFAVLDTEKLIDEQVEWLDHDLRASDRTFRVAVAHRPPYSSGKHGSDHGVRKTFGAVLAANAVDLVLLGHEHHYERTVPIDGVVYVISGGGGRGTRTVGESDWTALADRVAHFVYITADSQSLTLVAIDATGQDFDSVQLPARR